MARTRATAPRTAARAVTLALLLTSAGCAAGTGNTVPLDAPARAASDTPERFLVGTPQPESPLSEPEPGSACRNPMVDPRDGTRLRLVQSQMQQSRGVGDYAVPEGRYGVRADELLRLDCGTGRVIGIVRQRR